VLTSTTSYKLQEPKTSSIYSTVLLERRLVTDTQTDRQTDRRRQSHR